MFGDEFKHFLKLFIKWPIPEALNFPNLDFIQSQTFSIVDCMIGVKALLTDEACGLLALLVDAEVKDLLALMALDETFGCETPFGSEDLLEDFLTFGDEGGGLVVILLRKFFNFGQ
jgi:hypothetical protein